ncbi:MAG: aminopeptidase [Hyalangium sp.]|uniref:aminopeptidase n=1 Tax=Hyalangium sp. TaxID=2028555 RepID=UPI0038999AF7
MMNERWTDVARRAVEGLGVQPGELIYVRDGAGRWEVLQEMVFALERRGATPLIELSTSEHRRRMLQQVEPSLLESWDRHRQGWMERIDRCLALHGADFDPQGVPEPALSAWAGAVARLTRTEEARRIPWMVVAIPNEARARSLGLPLETLEARVLPAILLGEDRLRGEIDAFLRAARQARTLTLVTRGGACRLTLDRTGRPWLDDDGVIQPIDRERGAIVSNLPAGSIYTTVLEERTEGTVFLPRAGPAAEVVLTFEGGRITRAEASSGGEEFLARLDRHQGEPRRVGHLGIGLNPLIPQPLGWTLVDEHVHGAVFLALGENRYLGGANASTLNEDHALQGATLLADGVPLLEGPGQGA